MVGHRTCDLQVAGSSPGWALLRSVLKWAGYLHLCSSVTKQCNLVPAKGGALIGCESNRGPGGK